MHKLLLSTICLGLVSAAVAAGMGPGAHGAPAEPAAPGAAADKPAGTSSEKSLKIGDAIRSYVLHVPPGASGPLPVVMALHGSAGSPQQIQGYFNLNPVADREGFVVAYPQGIDRIWNDVKGAEDRLESNIKAAGDVAFLNALVDALVADGVADAKRIYLTGISNGGFMAMTMACYAGERFAAFAPVVASVPVLARENCKPGRPLPLLVMNGTKDPMIMWDGARAEKQGYLGGEAFFAFWSGLNGCNGAEETALPDVSSADESYVRVMKAKACAPGGETELYRIEGGGHQPPTREVRPRGTFLGARNNDIEAGEEIWAFFKRFSR